MVADHTQAWKIIGSLREKDDQSVPISTDRLVDHFSAVFAPPSVPPIPAPIPEVPLSPEHHHLVSPISPTEFDKAIADTNLTSAPGPDGLPPRLLIQCLSVPEFYVFLFQFITMCFLLSYVPTQWRTAHVFILYKGKGNPLDPNSYRGISLTPILGKLYERVLLCRLQQWASGTHLTQLPQFGFRPRCSTTQAVFTLQYM